ncbi:aldo/keto reductase [Staphylococcus simiae]|uniref:Aldo/keto reductase family oxidoreductase n=1 Tax=Staphylococcus simiae CCM 7213 = CCUG 51256 TaxID=911238 RepID=G5JL56_9STAP|nr:aldo/keto reductase [Staphylococcus simiae]EHJ07074.1 aldo/keto reductase family oxidoreductase [Staphylococcus simiae CCM 7213 = CCUG 51256]PNZ10030.1 oxidoreductase [Staphylococcus simiae]SNV63883.1 aldo/keto reductase family protein [Staphylococcus simiae]
MKRISINQHVTFSKLIQGFWRANQWNMTHQQLNTFINQLVERGITTMDHADIYGDYECEAIFGKALDLSPKLKENIQLVTKCGIVLPSNKYQFTDGHRYDLSSKHIIASVEQSLKNMNVDYVDNLLIHRPSPLMDPMEITEAVATLVDDGKIKSFGISNFNEQQYQLLSHQLTKEKLHISVNQLELSPYHVDNINNDIITTMYQQQVKVMAWSPFAGGQLFDPLDDKGQRIMAVIKQIANRYGVSPNAVIISWFDKLPHDIMPILGTSKLNRIDQAIEGLSITITNQEWFDIYTATLGHDIP